MNISIDSQGPEVTSEEEIYGETFAQHASHRFIDTETILLHVEEYSGNKYKTDKSIDVDVIETSNNDETQFVDDPRKGARTLENNLVYPGSNTLLGNETSQNENEIDDSGIDKVAVEEKANISTDSQRSEIMRGKEFHGETFAQHTSHRVINTETILMKSKYIMAEIVETNERTLTGEVHTHWDIIEVWEETQML